MFISEIYLSHRYFPQFSKFDMSKYGYLEVFQRVPSTSRKRELTVSIIGHKPIVLNSTQYVTV